MAEDRNPVLIQKADESISIARNDFPTLTSIRRIAPIMSLINLVHKNVIIKFTDTAKNQFNPEASYVFRLTGVDAMGFLLIQDLKPGGHAGHEAASEPYWINKDLVREIHELDLAKAKETLYGNGETTKPQAQTQIDPVRREVTPKPAKAKSPKQKSALN